MLYKNNNNVIFIFKIYYINIHFLLSYLSNDTNFFITFLQYSFSINFFY